MSLVPSTAPSTLVVLPGLDGTDVFFRPFLAAMPPSIHSVVVSFPQSGATGYRDLLDVVRQATAALPAFWVLGSSFSGPLAVLLAASDPTRVRGIVLAATFLRSPRPGLELLRFALVGPVVWLVRAARRLPTWLLRRRDNPFRKAKAETWSRVPVHMLAARAREVLRVDVRDALGTCPQPVLCVAFADDRAVPGKYSRRGRVPIVERRRLAADVSAFGGTAESNGRCTLFSGRSSPAHNRVTSKAYSRLS